MSPRTPESFLEPMGAKECAEEFGVASGNLPGTLRACGIPEPGPWEPGCRSFKIAAGAVYAAEDIRPAAAKYKARKAERERVRAATE